VALLALRPSRTISMSALPCAGGCFFRYRSGRFPGDWLEVVVEGGDALAGFAGQELDVEFFVIFV